VTRPRADVKELRRFGLVVGGIFATIGVWPVVARGALPRWWAVGLGMALIVSALAFARRLAPAYHVWMRLADTLAWINTRLLLSLVFFGLITPMGIGMRLFAKDPMRRGFNCEAKTYRVVRRSRPPTHMTRQF
jgi:hypothetical protein